MSDKQVVLSREDQYACNYCGEYYNLSSFLYRKDTNSYRWKCKPCRSDYYRKYREREGNKEANKDKCKRYYRDNKKHYIKQAKKWQKENPDKVRDSKAKWRLNNKYKTNEIAAARRQKESILRKIYKKECTLIYKECKKLNTERGDIYEVDHIIPLVHKDVCGLHVPWNLQIITRKENRKKSNKICQKNKYY